MGCFFFMAECIQIKIVLMLLNILDSYWVELKQNLSCICTVIFMLQNKIYFPKFHTLYLAFKCPFLNSHIYLIFYSSLRQKKNYWTTIPRNPRYFTRGDAMLDLMVTNIREQMRYFKSEGNLVELVEFSVLKDMSWVRIRVCTWTLGKQTSTSFLRR